MEERKEAFLECSCLRCGKHWEAPMYSEEILRCPRCHPPAEDQKDLFSLERGGIRYPYRKRVGRKEGER